MIVFCHIPKTAGMAVKYMLAANLGARFVSSTTWGKARAMTTAQDLRYELFVYPGARAIAGHGMRPFVDYGARESAFRWFTILRDPVARLVSHYVYDLENGRAGPSFEAWLHDDMGNYQVRWIAGEEDLDKARDLLERKFAFVGFQEDFRESLAVMNHVLFDNRLRLHSERRVNETRSKDIKERVAREVAEHADLIARAVRLDQELYAYARARFWETSASLRKTLSPSEGGTSPFPEASPGAGRMSRIVHHLHRAGFYKPTLLLAKLTGVRK